MVDVTHDGDRRRTRSQIVLVTLVLAELDVETLQQFAVLVLGRDDLDVVVELGTQHLKGVIGDGLRGIHHLAQVEEHLHQGSRLDTDLLGQVGQRSTATEPNGLAAASDAVIIGFNVRAQGKATQLADAEGVDVRYYSVIYSAIDEVEAALKGMLKPIYEEQIRGQAQIREIFRSSKVGTIAGCMVLSGTIRRNASARLLRDGIVVHQSSIASLRREKDDATEVREGFECGMTLANYSDIRVDDIIETFEMVEKPRN